MKGKIVAGDFDNYDIMINTSTEPIRIVIEGGEVGTPHVVKYDKDDVVAFEKASDETVRKFWATSGGVAGGAAIGAITLGLLTGGVGLLAGAIAGGLVCGKRQQYILVLRDGKKFVFEVKQKYVGPLMLAFM